VTSFARTAQALEDYDSEVLTLLARLATAAERGDEKNVEILTADIEALAAHVALAFFEDTKDFNDWETVKGLRAGPKTAKEPSFIRRCVASWKAEEAAKC
jgi:hypothetical protein